MTLSFEWPAVQIQVPITFRSVLLHQEPFVCDHACVIPVLHWHSPLQLMISGGMRFYLRPPSSPLFSFLLNSSSDFFATCMPFVTSHQ